ncbi:TetR/AcrR family transcriptional regulator [Streptomyces diastatochromogenes]|uniref:TetR/AcrR family transcriptional regulator n=1 Tax=Streptomyces diastatochromogenes TaxID=42236 RepID=UPI000B919525|nr:TetR/AcrR family transcriptional regulator [Streptomyces diastatochromogenes]MCZ0987965.1 TetR/AcrR family transcriptional regulator [Streptomyces diastatochromogenes]
MATERTDQRREAGQRTRDGLLAAAQELLARRGQEGVTLREITDRAGANVSAVSYHFGSLKALCDSAIENALERYLDAQIDEVASLDTASGVEDLAAAFAGPMMRALAAGGQDLAVMRTVARVGIDPPEGWGRLTAKFQQSRRDVVRQLSARIPGVEERELDFRIRCAAGLLNWLVLAPIGTELAAEPPEQIERWLVPVLAGAFRGSPNVG